MLLARVPASAQEIDTITQKTLREMVITGNFPAYLRALETQRKGTGVVSVLNLDLPGRFPDLNPAEALQRLPGIVVQRSEGEGRFIHIRGAAPALTTVQINGEQIISPESKSRFLQFDLLPVDQLRAVEVYKTNLPDQDGDAIGGSINLLTRNPTNGPGTWRAAVAGGFNPAAGLPNGQAQVAYSGKNLLVNASIWQDHRATERLETVYGTRDFGNGDELWINSLELHDAAVARRRLGVSSEYILPCKNQSGQVYVRGMYVHFIEQNLRQRLRYRPEKGSSATTNDTIFGAQVGRDIQHIRETEQFISLQTGADHTWNRWKIDAAAAYSHGLESEPEGQSLDFQLYDADLLRSNTDPKFPQYRITNGLDAYNYGAYQLNEVETENERSTDQSLTGRANARFQLHRATDFFKFGVKVRTRRKSSRASEQIYDAYTGAAPLRLPDFLQSNADFTLFNRRYNFGQCMDWDKTNRLIATQKAEFQLNEAETTLESTAGNFDIRENTAAGYLLAHFQRGRWEWIAGLRVEHTQYRYAADQAVVDTAIQVTPLGRVFSGNYTFLLPTISAKYISANGLQWRATLGSSYARPGFDQLAPFELFNQLDGEVLAGNPNLQPAYAWNADVAVEKLLKNGGSLSAALFGKRIEHFIFTQQSRDTRLWNGSAVNVLATVPLNGEAAWLAGIELGWQQQLVMLPGAWSGLGIYANYTYTWSRATAEPEETEDAEEGFRLPGQAAHSGNLAVWYDYRHWSGRVALNVQSDFLLQAAEPEDAALQLIYGGSAQVDLNIGYALGKHWTLFGEGMNLLNTPLRYYTGDATHPAKLERYGAWGRVGVKVVW